MNAYAYHRRNRVRLLGTPRASTNPTVREPVIEITDAEKVAALASELSDKAKRQIERERGWPAGSLG